MCFKSVRSGYIAVLIDLDRALPLNIMSIPSYEGEMYQKPKTWRVNRLDWKQLGILARNVVSGEDAFLGALISDGKVLNCICSVF